MSTGPAHDPYHHAVKKGPLAWMASNAVAANLLMAIFIVGGLIMAGSIKKEVFPEIDLDAVTVRVAYPGASPEEVEEGIVLAVEEEARGVDGVKKVTSTSKEGEGVVIAEILLGEDPDAVLNDVKSAVDRITSFPQDAERPVISLATSRTQVLNLIVFGDLDFSTLRTLTEQMRSELLEDNRITLIEVDGLPPPEISVEIEHETLRRYGLTLDAVGRTIGNASIDLPGGSVKTPGGEVLLRTTERRNLGEEFEDITLLANPDGTRVQLGDVARIVDGFRETDTQAFYDGRRAARLKVFRIGRESPAEVSVAVHEYIASVRARLPDSVGLVVTDDRSDLYNDRVGLLVKNGRIGAVLVLVVLGLFLQPRLALWVTLGIPISFLGAFLFMPALGVSINMISMFAFILTLGIVVDDAVVVGEAVYKQRREGAEPMVAAIRGTREVLTPVIFAVLTTVIAFAPLLFVPGVMGKFFTNIPLIVIPILLISLFESLLVLPAHLAHIGRDEDVRHWRITAAFTAWQRRFSDGLERLIDTRFVPFVNAVTRARYLTISVGVAMLVVTLGVVAGGRVPFVFFPEVEGDTASATVEMPFGASVEDTIVALEYVARVAEDIAREVDGEGTPAGEGLLRGIYAEIGGRPAADVNIGTGAGDGGGHLGFLTLTLQPAGDRRIAASELVARWRERSRDIPGLDRLSFTYNVGPQAGAPVSVQLSHRDPRVLEDAASRLARRLESYAGVGDIDDGFQVGKVQLDLELKPAARSLGITERELATQVRSAFFGAEAKRQQRERDELRVYVRLPREQRESVYFLENLVIQAPGGGEIPLSQAATVTRGYSFTTIEREDGRRVVEVTADVDTETVTAGQVIGSLERDVLPALLADTPGLTYSLSGEQENQKDSIDALSRGMLLAMIAMYALLAIAFRSYSQPLLVLLAIPFGLVGAVAGHAAMGYSLSFVSLLGIVALAGVVVNDSLVLISAINDYRRAGMSAPEAVIAGSTRRVRPVLLTSLTTFFGLAPMIFETSLQARFLIPMAISLGFGVLFVTGIALLLVPSAYLALEDVKRRLTRDHAAPPLVPGAVRGETDAGGLPR